MRNDCINGYRKFEGYKHFTDINQRQVTLTVMQTKPVAIHFIDSLFRGGAQRVVVDVVEALPQFQHVVCYWSDEDDLKPDLISRGALLVQLPFKGVWTFPVAYWVFLKTMLRHRPAYIHSHMFIPNLFVRFLPRIGFVSLSTYHGSCLSEKGFKGSVIRLLERLTYWRTDCIITVSEFVRDYIREKLNTNRPIEVVHNYGSGVANAVYIVKKELPLRLIATSNNHYYKGYPLLIEAMSRLKDKPVELDIYGHGMEPIKTLAESLHANNVRFKGLVKNIPEVLKEYSCFVICSDSGEGFSLALLEAMQARVPVICSDIPQFTEAVGTSALIFRKGEVESLVEKIEQLIANPQHLVSLSEGSRQRAAFFSKEIFTERIQRIYQFRG